ncbi:uncharacterized protein LOC128226813 [Mya arenaria]|uniref:uncharacterized protein LOC128226813 n=1 Tax=Mya arenaria TaxID=6604 RepID=UPI0022E4A86E|nr:uncharacterized protein LOC128226813 [Mya arenaria]XP_052792840.1 uncharacterized protein LOC128226813 [Mya arenaria]
MSAAFSSGVSNVPGPQTSQAFPLIDAYHSPLPQSFSLLDNRTHFLQAKHHKFLEMHPNGVRGVNSTTPYCVLWIMIINLSASLSQTPQPMRPDLWQPNKSPEPGSAAGRGQRTSGGSHLSPRHVIFSNVSKKYLCMDDRSVVYQSANYSPNQCAFFHEQDGDFRDQYFRQLNATSEKWFLGINKDGSVRCGNVTRRKQEGARFNRLDVTSMNTRIGASPPFGPDQRRRTCCKRRRCKNNKLNKKGDDQKCVRLKERCKRDRRKVFSLDLKKLKKYYNKCIDPDSYFMKNCKRKKLKSKSGSGSKRRNRKQLQRKAKAR